MSYNIHITAAAERDLIRAAGHIEFVLKKPMAADGLLDEAENLVIAVRFRFQKSDWNAFLRQVFSLV